VVFRSRGTLYLVVLAFKGISPLPSVTDLRAGV
jgi:hypothetical protein